MILSSLHVHFLFHFSCFSSLNVKEKAWIFQHHLHYHHNHHFHSASVWIHLLLTTTLMRLVLLFPPIWRSENWATARPSAFPRATQLLSGKVHIWAQLVWCQSPSSQAPDVSRHFPFTYFFLEIHSSLTICFSSRASVLQLPSEVPPSPGWMSEMLWSLWDPPSIPSPQSRSSSPARSAGSLWFDNTHTALCRNTHTLGLTGVGFVPCCLRSQAVFFRKREEGRTEDGKKKKRQGGRQTVWEEEERERRREGRKEEKNSPWHGNHEFLRKDLLSALLCLVISVACFFLSWVGPY